MRKLTVRYALLRRTAGKGGKKANSGFSLMETLLVVAILVILLGLSMLGVARWRDQLKIVELDNAARDIYMAAENRAVLLQNSGQLGTPSATLLSSDVSNSLVDITVTDADGTSKAARMLSKDTNPVKLNELLPVGVIDPALRNGDFRVIYDEKTGHVIETFYSEETINDLDDDGNFDNNKLKELRDTRSARVTLFRSGKQSLVGHYQSDAADEIGTKPLPTPGVEVIIENGDELTLTVRYTMPALPTGLDASDVTRTPSVRLEYGDRTIILLGTADTDEEEVADGRGLALQSGSVTLENASSGDIITYTCVLDSLEQKIEPDGAGGFVYTTYTKQFKSLPKSPEDFPTIKDFTALGDDFTVTASLKLKATGYIDSAYYAQGSANSLFAGETTYKFINAGGTITGAGTAKIANLRHLQNLHPGHSKVGTGTVKAEQLRDIDCKESRKNGWETAADDEKHKYVLNENYMFIPIVNDSLTSYNGKSEHIFNLSTKETANAGLFGKVSSGLEITDCRVCWKDADIGKLVTGGAIDCRVKGTNAGGLIGCVSGGNVTIENSFAATTVEGTDNAGGLVGSVTGSGSLTVEKSYADCYLKGKNAGGLVGSGNVYKLANCYAAGFIVDPASTAKTAGLVNGGAPDVSCTYSVVRVLNTQTVGGKTTTTLARPKTTLYDGATEPPSGVRYLYKAEGLGPNPFGPAFEYDAATPETHVYDLRHKVDDSAKSLKEGTPPKGQYPYPGLDGLPHYSDWADLEDSPAGLAYYEVYDDGSCGAYGQHECNHINSLPDKLPPPDPKRKLNPTVVKDGYALVFDEAPEGDYTIEYGDGTAPQKWTLQKNGGNWAWTKGSAPAPGSTPDQTVAPLTPPGKYLIPLPDEIVAGPLRDNTNFYQKLTAQLGSYVETNRTFYFNPHFARSVQAGKVTLKTNGTVDTYEKPVKPGDPKGATAEEYEYAYVRTARHLYDLSVFQGLNYNYAHQDPGLYFKQELDVDYSKYTEGYTGGFTGSYKYNVTGGTGNDKQAPIGTDTTAFLGTYDGGCHIIRRVFFTIGTQTNLGLFGETEVGSTLTNIVYEQKIVLDSGKKIIPETVTKDGANVGALVGRNNGTVENCAVFGVNMNVTAGNVGGLVGLNNGSVERCAAEVASVTSHCTNAGGLVGLNDSTVSSSYAVGKISQKTGGTLAGLVAKNNGSVSTSYAALNLNSDAPADAVVATYGLCGGTASDAASVWFKDAFVYRGEKYNTAAIDSYKDPGKGVSLNKLENNLSGTMSKVTNNTVKSFPIGGATYENDYKGGFPYLSSMKGLWRSGDGKIASDGGGQPIHYGLWPAPLPVGLAYYEQYSWKYNGGKGYDASEYGVLGSYEGEDIDTGLADDTLIHYNSDSGYGGTYSNKHILKDGYAVVFDVSDGMVPDGDYPFLYGNSTIQTWTLEKKTTDTVKWTWKQSSQDGGVVTPFDISRTINEKKFKYLVVPLANEVVTGVLSEKADAYAQWDNLPENENELNLGSATKFYQELVYGKDYFGERTFYFNPHFAKTVEAGTMNSGVYNVPSRPDEPEITKENIILRTPRHFYALSRFQYTYDYKERYFLQELDLDYNIYNWYGEADKQPTKKVRTEAAGGTYYEQASIAMVFDGQGFAANGAYDGGGHTIRNVFYRTPTTTKNLQYLGLFKYINYLKNVTYEVPDNMVVNLTNAINNVINGGPADGYQDGIKVGALAGGSFIPNNCGVEINNLTVTSENADIYVGGMFGHVNGNVDSGGAKNCNAVIYDTLTVERYGTAGGYIDGNDVTNRMDVSAGGLAGVVVSTLTESSSTVNKMHVTGNDYCYAGGLVGRTSTNYSYAKLNRRTLRNCDATVTELTVAGTGEVYGGGLTGWGDNILYCSAVVKGNLTVTTTGTAPKVYHYSPASNVTYVSEAPWFAAYAGGLAGGGSDIEGCTATAKSIKVTKTGTGVSDSDRESCSNGGGLVGVWKMGYHSQNETYTFPDLKILSCNVKTTNLEVKVESGTAYGGGLVGRIDHRDVQFSSNNYGDLQMESCGAVIESLTTDCDNEGYTGGLVGFISSNSNIKNSTAEGEAASYKPGTTTGAGAIGAFVGKNEGTINGCTSTVTVSGGAAGRTGGFVGEGNAPIT